MFFLRLKHIQSKISSAASTITPTPATTLAIIVGSVWLLEGVLLDCWVFPDPVRVALGDRVSDAVVRVEVVEARAGRSLIRVVTDVGKGALAADRRSAALNEIFPTGCSRRSYLRCPWLFERVVA